MLFKSESLHKPQRLGRYRIFLMMAITLVTGSYLWLETNVIPHNLFTSCATTTHWGFAGIIWLSGLIGIQFGYLKLCAGSRVLEQERNNLLAIFDAVQVGMVLIDQQMRVLCLNHAMLVKFNKSLEERDCSRSDIRLRCPNNQNNLLACCDRSDCEARFLMQSLRETLYTGQSASGQEARFISEYDGVRLDFWTLYAVTPLELGGRRLALLSLLDVTERKEAEQQLRELQQELHSMAFYDSLTGLPNRMLFNDRLQQHITEQRRSRQTEKIGILFLDLDGFKSVNDSLGHAAGDQLLQEAGARIRACLREQDTVARLGGDEFAVVLPEVRHELDPATVARKVLTAIEQPFEIGGRQLFISTSIGIACWPVDSRDAAELVRFADAAMYHAKSQGRNNYQFYSEELTLNAVERMHLESDLRKALLQEELELYYQPKVNTLVGMLVGAEALIRWHHPVRGLVPPDRFIGIAEDTGMIVSIGAWVLQTACRTVVSWNCNALFPLKIAVNLSVRQFMTGNLVDTVQTALRESGCRPEWLELEITESLLMTNKPEVTTTLDDLHRMGVTIAIDDFGTGYSALSYLIDFPVSTVKIDKSFVSDIVGNNKNLALAKTIISMGHALGLELVAEGVETGGQAACLDKLGCRIVQGYFYGRPMPLQQFTRWLHDFNTSRQQAFSEADFDSQSSWRDYLTTGHDLIDSQHRELFRRITTLTIACRSGKAQDEVVQLLDYLDGYVKTHFSAEEQLMITSGSPHYTVHKAAHGNFYEMIDMLRARYQAEGVTASLTVETNYLAVEWLTKHICTMDRALADSMQHQTQEKQYELSI
jgi:diguanylate cyclase (GGDEF)-like protein/hemerythrin-like metal-binding protein